MNVQLEKAAAALAARGFEPHVFDTAEQAAAYFLSQLPADAPVAIGGSMTIKNLGLADTLRETGHEVLWHWDAPADERAGVLYRAVRADFYLASANAITESGVIVQIDGTGNRVSALCFGPKTVCLIAGKNKLVSGGYAQAVARIKSVACPPNAQRLGLDTPCAKTGKCNSSECPNSMCAVTAAFERPTRNRRFLVLLVDEELGY